MKKKIIAILLLSIMILSNFNINVVAEEQQLLPAVVVTSNGEKWGYIDQTGAFKIKPTYDYAYDFNDKGIAIVANGKSSYDLCDVYFINKSGKIIAGPFYSYIPNYINGMAIMNIDGKGLVVDETGKIILKSKYSLFEYIEGLVSFVDNNLYGFMDLTGKVIIPAKYKYVTQSFKDGKACLETTDGNYSIIDKNGKVLRVLKDLRELFNSDGLTRYYEESSDKYGYKNADGTVVIAPKFNYAIDFNNDYAIVAISNGNYGLLYGLIDNKGNYVIKPKYTGIHELGQGLYSVSAVSNDLYMHDSYAPKAVFNNKGEQLTDYKYYSIAPFEGDYGVASDNTTTFFIDKKGNKVDSLPQLKGIGNMKFIGDFIKADLDGGLTYLKENGEIIWQKAETTPFSNNINVKKIKYRRDYATYIEYPEISGMSNTKLQTQVNAKLKKDFISGYETPQKENEYSEDYSLTFEVTNNKDLLIIEKSGYWYPIGAAHGQPSKEYLYINTKTGVFYELKDLFKANSKYTDKLASIVNYQIKMNTKVGAITEGFSYDTNNVKVAKNQGFILGKDSIKVYYTPYEIACYAAGFPEFEIPYGQLTSIIDIKGAFWNSFDKNIVNSKINNLSGIDDRKIKALESLMSSYEKNMIDAINSNNFSKVESCLLKGSSLYNSQTKLVQSLNKQNIKEKLTKYEIYAITHVYNDDSYKVFVLEEVAVKYPGKNYVNKKYQWCYTVKADQSGAFKLSNIQKW